MGKKGQDVDNYDHNKLEVFGKGKDKSENFWNSILRQALLESLAAKDIENYGLLKLTEKGHAFIKKPVSIHVPLNRDFDELEAEADEDGDNRGGALDQQLLTLLKDLRKKISKQKDLPPFVIFQDPSLEDMATQYPITLDELGNITGVSQGKAMRYGKEFIKTIKQYVEENDIDRPTDFTVKSVASKSVNKVYIIQHIDRKVPLEDIAKAKDMSRDDFFHELETIIASGTRLNIDYYIDDVLDEEIQDIIYDYFRSAETDSIEVAFAELEDEGVTREEIQMMRIKFMSEMAN